MSDDETTTGTGADHDDAPDILARVEVSPARRWFGIVSMGALGVVMLWMSLSHPPQTLGLQAFLLGMGGLGVYMAVRMHKATELSLELTRDVLRDSSGTVLARVDEIRRVDRGALAFKPSQGFLLVLDRPMPARWQPGLWWRVGRRVGVGGVTSAAMAKTMAEIIQLRLTPPPQA